jgi:cation:H+ antiporter
VPFNLIDLASLLGAVILAAIGGEIFLKAVISLARWLGVSDAVVATTVAAFATSSPELTVSTMAAFSAHPEIGLGDALGSNVVNIALVFGLALGFGPVRPERDDFGRNFKLALFVPPLTLALAMDGRISRIDGSLLLLSV